MDDKELVTRNAQEVVSERELDRLLSEGGPRKAYVGFEPSGLAHIGWKILGNKIIDLQKAGFEVVVLLADWHAYINDKYGGDMEAIQTCAKYMEDCFMALGVDEEKITFTYASEMVGDPGYWEKVIKIAKNTTLLRMKRALTVMGRKEEEADTDTSKFFYPAMQAADIYHLDVGLALGGMDQRKAHMLARDAADKLGWKKFVALHTPLLSGLQGGDRMDPAEAKMSKSNPMSSISLHDTEEDLRKKLKKAYCPLEMSEGNPVMEMARYIVFQEAETFTIPRDEKWGGDMMFKSYRELKQQYDQQAIHPLDLKMAVANHMVNSLKPVWDYFEAHPDNLARVRELAGGK